ncbi:ricin-type beta-trefoil lectin domain protein [Streptomyces sp. NPDC001262]|uniref:RICIN domain-containing protein n=1 Tax=Streptomyces TaxID=1883 RepID=UPI0036CAF25F
MRNIKKRVLARLATAAAAVPLAVVGISGEAFAYDGERVPWINVATGRCLAHDQKHDVFTMDMKGCVAYWVEYEHGGNIYTLTYHTGNGGPGRLLCLDSSDAGRVYLNPCNGSNYQKWRQTKTSTGWKLTNAETGRVLDSSDGGKVYTKPDNGGRYQRWR